MTDDNTSQIRKKKVILPWLQGDYPNLSACADAPNVEPWGNILVQILSSTACGQQLPTIDSNNSVRPYALFTPCRNPKLFISFTAWPFDKLHLYWVKLSSLLLPDATDAGLLHRHMCKWLDSVFTVNPWQRSKLKKYVSEDSSYPLILIVCQQSLTHLLLPYPFQIRVHFKFPVDLVRGKLIEAYTNSAQTFPDTITT